MKSNLYNRINYSTNIPYIINGFIREYDLSKANISSLLYEGRITEEEYNEFFNMDKVYREIKIGLMIKNDFSIYRSIRNGIQEAKRRLVEANDISDSEIVSIKNDAVFVYGRKLHITDFPPFSFKEKNIYTIFIKLANLEIYYMDNQTTDGSISTNIDIKGISDEKINLHSNGMLDIVCDTCYMLQRDSPYNVLSYLTLLYQKFINRQLPINYYRSFDSNSNYSLNIPYRKMFIQTISEEYKGMINIDRNNLIFRDLLSIVSDIYRRYK